MRQITIKKVRHRIITFTPTAYPEGSASLMYVLDFLYNYLLYGQRVEEAHWKASNYPDDRKQFKLYPVKADSTQETIQNRE